MPRREGDETFRKAEFGTLSEMYLRDYVRDAGSGDSSAPDDPNRTLGRIVLKQVWSCQWSPENKKTTGRYSRQKPQHQSVKDVVLV